MSKILGRTLSLNRRNVCNIHIYFNSSSFINFSRPQGSMPPSGPESDLLGGPGGVGAEGLTPLGGGGGPKPPEDFSGVEQGGVTMDHMESVMEPLQFDYNSQMQMDSAPTVGLFDYTNQQQVRVT